MAAPAGDGGLLERTHLVRLRRGGLALGAVALAAALWWIAARGTAPVGERSIPGERIPYTVEVLNGTDVNGLARAVTRRLRRAGIDVVFYGTASGEPLDSTVVMVRSDAADAGLVVREALGIGRVVAEPDARSLLDVTVLLGRDAAGVTDGDR